MKIVIKFISCSFIFGFYQYSNAQVGEVFIAKKFNPGTHIMNLVELQRSSDSGQSLSVNPFYNSRDVYDFDGYDGKIPASKIIAVQDFLTDYSYNDYYNNTNFSSGQQLEYVCKRPNGLTVYDLDSPDYSFFGFDAYLTYNFPSYGIKGFRPACGGDINGDGTADILLQKRAQLSAFVITNNSSYYYYEIKEDLQFYNKTISINPAPDSRFKALGLLDIDNTNGVDLLVQVRKSIGIYANTGDTNGVVFSNFTKLYDLQKGERFVGIFNINNDPVKEIVLQKGASVSALSAPDYNTASLQVVLPTHAHKILGPR